MAMTTCRQCEGTVSTEARACPHCGAAAPAPVADAGDAQAPWRAPLFALMALVVLVGGAFWYVDYAAERDTEDGLRECRDELLAEGRSAADPAFDLAVAMCNINRD
jgi:hypothetical protein